MAEYHQHALPKGYGLGRYSIEAVLGAGGFAITYLAQHVVLDQKVAIKEYLPDECGLRIEGRTTVRAKRGEEEEFAWGLDRFTDEARTLSKFSHPSIAPVTDIFEANGTAYMVMPYQEGESLEVRLGRDGTLPEGELRKLLDPLLDALTLVHASNILHRDIKPSNIFIRTDGTPMLLDFGNARQALGTKSRSLTATLTPGYAPNEQYVTRGNQGPWTDVYSLGATLYKAIVGNVPPEAPERAMKDSYVPAITAAKGRYSPALLEAIDKSLAFQPGDRPQDIGAFRSLLESDTAKARRGASFAGGTLRPASAPGGGDAPTRRIKARRWAVALAVLLVSATAAGGYLAVNGWPNGGTERTRVTTKRVPTEQARKELEQARTASAEARRKSVEEARKRAAAERRARIAEEARLAAERERKTAVEARLRTEEEKRKRVAAEARARAVEEARRKAETARRNEEDQRRAAGKRKIDEARRTKTGPPSGAVIQDCAVCPQMVVIPAGSFIMGSPTNEPARRLAEGPRHRVVIPRKLAFGQFEVTFAEWDACVSAGGCSHKPKDNGWGRGTQPVVNVSWHDAMSYAAWLTKKTRKRYRLPSESEWEYAARARTKTARYWGVETKGTHANCKSCGTQWDYKRAAPVGRFKANPFGLHDMLGNVWEWVSDCWTDTYDGWNAGRSKPGSGQCKYRVTRGGSFLTPLRDLRAAVRSGDKPDRRDYAAGFRVVRELE